MLGWLRRNEGFEWHKYVRTTIKLRRQDRRRKVNDAGQAMAKGLGKAGKSTVEAGGATLSGLGQVSSRMTAFLASLATTMMAGANRLVGGVGRGMAPVIDRIMQPSIRLALAFSGVGVGAYAIARWQSIGWTSEVVALLGFAVVAVLVANGPLMAARVYDPVGAMLARLIEAAGRLPLLSRIGTGGMKWLVAGLATVVVAGGAAVGLSRTGTTFSMPKLSMMSAPLIEGRATAVTGDTVRIGDKLLKLEGIEAPERDQRCSKPGNKKWRCGTAATDALSAKIRGKSISCTPGTMDDAGRIPARCTLASEDVAASLVKDGHAFAASGLFSRYGSLEAEARNRKVGLWAGDAERPSDFRAKRWDEAKRKAPAGCPIKGQVTSSRGREYVVPWFDGYEQIQIRQTRGERWFCSEDEARAAGFKAAERG